MIKKNLIWMRVFFILSVLVICFIFSQSVLSREQSGGKSARILEAILSLLGSLKIEPDPDLLHKIIRKSAHFFEFAVLGVCVGGFSWNLGCLHNRKYITLPLWITLLVAVCDEFIQFFSGRASAVTDVVLDYSGAIFGLLFVVAYITIKTRLKGEIKNEN